MDSLSDPAALVDDPDVDHRRESGELPEDVYERFVSDSAGMVGLAVTREDGAVLLAQGPHGWAFPYVNVLEDDDWVAVATDRVEAYTGVAVEATAPLRGREVEYRVAGGDRSNHTYQVLLAGPTVAGERAAEMADDEVGWFTEVPDDADGVEDVEYVFDRFGGEGDDEWPTA